MIAKKIKWKDKVCGDVAQHVLFSHRHQIRVWAVKVSFDPRQFAHTVAYMDISTSSCSLQYQLSFKARMISVGWVGSEWLNSECKNAHFQAFPQSTPSAKLSMNSALFVSIFLQCVQKANDIATGCKFIVEMEASTCRHEDKLDCDVSAAHICGGGYLGRCEVLQLCVWEVNSCLVNFPWEYQFSSGKKRSCRIQGKHKISDLMSSYHRIILSASAP